MPIPSDVAAGPTRAVLVLPTRRRPWVGSPPVQPAPVLLTRIIAGLLDTAGEEKVGTKGKATPVAAAEVEATNKHEQRTKGGKADKKGNVKPKCK
mmetsp:Transcript_29930/g.88590  ORF Transcript_29930/g.88590 Transcript_29930/m.88590 type:complete len:95 (+) Transcript_29930:448-732(+)